jgi:membrane protein YdbS with pleckstrin-like domain
VLAIGQVNDARVAEETVWRGTSSQWKNLRTYLGSVFLAAVIVAISLFASGATAPALHAIAPFILLALGIPFLFALARYLRTKAKVYELTTERLKVTEGVFSKVTDTLELYRVKDLETRQPFWWRLFGLENVQINTSDTSTPFVLIDAVPSALGLGDKIRNAVEAVRMQKGVREIDIE